MTYWPVIIAFILSFGLIPVAAALARRFGYVDTPGGRKQHDTPTPPVGGLVVIPAIMAGLWMAGIDTAQNGPLFYALALLLLTGFVDDRWHINAKIKFALHFAAAFILVLPTDITLHNLGRLLSADTFELGVFAVPFTVACIVYLINALNMCDGVDGLSASIALVITGWLAAGAGQAAALPGFLAVTAAALLGFWLHNMRFPWLRQARVFMGDSGSMALGVLFGWFCIRLTQEPAGELPAIAVAWVIALPIFDAFGLFFTRIRRGKNPFSPDRNHLHHHFLDSGFSASATSLTIAAWAALYGLVGVGGTWAGVPEAVLTWLWIALWAGHTVLTLKPAAFRRLLSGIRARWSGPARPSGQKVP